MPRTRFFAVWILCLALLAAAAAGVLLAVYVVLAPAEQRQFSGMLAAGGNMLFVLSLIHI